MLDYIVGHYVHQKDLTCEQSLIDLEIIITEKVFPDGTMDYF